MIRLRSCELLKATNLGPNLFLQVSPAFRARVLVSRVAWRWQ
jgi:hypothetical protein